jgi:anthranilate synthase component I
MASGQGRYSFVGAQPAMEVVVKEQKVTVLDHATRSRTVTQEADPLGAAIEISRKWKPVVSDGLPEVFTGGWVGYCGYDTVRYVYAGAHSS